jgi:hypothetical protein
MSGLRLSFHEFRDQLIADREGSNAEKLAFALGFFESLVIGLCHDQRNLNVVQKQITKYYSDKNHANSSTL